MGHFAGDTHNSQWGIFSPTQLLVGPGAVVDGQTLLRAELPHLNNKGELLYTGTLAGEVHAVFLGEKMILGPGTVIDGRTVFEAVGAALLDDGTVGVNVRYEEQGRRITAALLASPSPDTDADGVGDEEDACPNTHIPEQVPTSGRLKVGRFALRDNDTTFDTKFSQRVFTTADTAGCNCTQILRELDLSRASRKEQMRFGCTFITMKKWFNLVKPN
jgi:hypothetical protein